MKQGTNILIAGVGGQGTLLTSRILGRYALSQGLEAKVSEVHGMAQRGGCVIGHNRIGRSIADLYSPIIPAGGAHLLIAFEPAEAVRQLHFLSRDGRAVVCDTAVKPIGGGAEYDGTEALTYLRENVKYLNIIPGAEIMRTCAKALNVALCAAAAEAGALPFDANALWKVIPEIIPERFIEINRTAFELGRRLI